MRGIGGELGSEGNWGQSKIFGAIIFNLEIGNRGQIMISSKAPSPRRKGEAILDGSTEHLSCPESLTH